MTPALLNQMTTMKHTRIALLAACGGLLAACSDLTNIERTGVVQPTAQNNTTGALAMHAGATQKFVFTSQNSILFSGLFADELVDANGAGLVYGQLDARREQNSTNQTGQLFTEFNNALVALRFATRQLAQYAPAPGWRRGQMYSYQGYLETYLADQFCNGIPLSTIDFGGNITYGSGTSTTETYGLAVAHFDSALSFSADSARILNLARLGKGRGLLNLGRFAEAAAAVAAVPTSFLYNLDISAGIPAQQNSLYTTTTLQKRVVVPSGSDGANGINWAAANDPRVRVAANGKGFDGVVDAFSYVPFASTGAAVRLASGVEARLIEAEAALRANNNDASTTGTGWLGILNALRASAVTPALAPLADPGSYDARVNLLFRERAFWTYLTANRMGDLRRLVRQYGRDAEAVFPTGPYRDGQPRGTAVNLTVPNLERSNPAYTGCIDRKA
ncbi:MAG: RagB/SusD protein [Gemmatimonadetes bacterium]|jgi:hypothetical protein|nr:RagB/SusD protein [Gemmatimonadota bacterium]